MFTRLSLLYRTEGLLQTERAIRQQFTTYLASINHHLLACLLAVLAVRGLTRSSLSIYGSRMFEFEIEMEMKKMMFIICKQLVAEINILFHSIRLSRCFVVSVALAFMDRPTDRQTDLTDARRQLYLGPL